MRRFFLLLASLSFFSFPARAEANQAQLPFVLNVSPWEDGVMLQGSVPTKKQKSAILQAAVEALGEENVSNHLKLSPQTTPEPWIDELPGLIKNFLEFSPGKTDFTIVDGKIILEGEIGDRKKYEILRGEIYGEAPDALVFEDRITVNGVRMVPPKEEETSAPEPPQMAKVEPESAPKPQAEKKVEEAAPLVKKSNPNPESGPTKVAMAEAKKALKYFGPVAMKKENEVKASAKTGQVSPAEEPVNVEASIALVMPKPESKPAAALAPKSIPEPKPAPKKVEMASGEYGPDPGGPILFYFDTASSQLRSEDRHKIHWIIERCKRPRTIVYITGYADFRGSYTLNRKLTTERTENVRRAIFAGDVADDLKADVQAKGEIQSDQKDSWRSDVSEKALQYRRRVVVETYHLK